MNAKDLTIASAKANLKLVLKQSTLEERKAGFIWYLDAYFWADTLAWELQNKGENVSTKQVAAVTSAFSPRCNWEHNKTLVKRYLAGDRSGMMKMCVVKADKIMQLKDFSDMLDVLNGSKTKAFASNILTAGSTMQPEALVTVDTHIANASLGVRDNKQAAKIMSSDKLYNYVQEAFHLLSWEPLGRVCYSAQELQAIVWITWKRLHNIH